MKNKFLIIQVLSIIAFINACYLSYKAYFVRFIDPFGFTSFCDISKTFTCTDVLRHPLSEIFGLSFPWIAMLVYPIIFVLAFISYKRYKEVYVKILVGISFFGYCLIVLFSTEKSFLFMRTVYCVCSVW